MHKHTTGPASWPGRNRSYCKANIAVRALYNRAPTLSLLQNKAQKLRGEPGMSLTRKWRETADSISRPANVSDRSVVPLQASGHCFVSLTLRTSCGRQPGPVPWCCADRRTLTLVGRTHAPSRGGPRHSHRPWPSSFRYFLPRRISSTRPCSVHVDGQPSPETAIQPIEAEEGRHADHTREEGGDSRE